jgi:hypothetical protein
MAKFRSVFTIVAADAYDLRRPHRNQQGGFFARDRINAPGAEALEVAGGFFRWREQNPHNGVAPGDGLDQSVLSLAIELKSAISHCNLYNHIFLFWGGREANIGWWSGQNSNFIREALPPPCS